MPFYSVIIPAYNCEKYLSDAVESVRRQPIKDIEIIIVDDGSTDSTGQICDRLAGASGAVSDEKHRETGQEPAVFVIHQDNRGASAARNAGIRRASGEYVLFLDADDVYAEDALDEKLSEECRRGRYDMIICSSLTSNVDRDRYGIDIKMHDGVFAGGQACPISGHFASCLYSRQMLLAHHILFDEDIHLNEDEAFKMKAMYAAVRIRTHSKPLYIYNTTPGSVRYTDRHIYDFVEAWIRTYQWLEEYGSMGRLDQAKAYVRQKIVSRQLLYAKLYVQQGHSLKQMLGELERIDALETLRNLPVEYMIPSQREELVMFQKDTKRFAKYARQEGRKIRLGRMLLKVRWVRRKRDRKKFPIKL